MKILLILLAIIVVAFIFKSYLFGDKPELDASRPSDNKKPTLLKENDKLILVSNVTHDDIKNALVKFCNLYNKNNWDAQPRLWQLASNSFAVTFPYDIDFVTYCFAVNFLKYPIDIKWDSHVRAWVTTKTGEEWVTEKSANKNVMLYLADDDKEYDNVFLTTQDNIGYKLGFAMGKESQLLNVPKENYVAPTVNDNSLQKLKYEDFQ